MCKRATLPICLFVTAGIVMAAVCDAWDASTIVADAVGKGCVRTAVAGPVSLVVDALPVYHARAAIETDWEIFCAYTHDGGRVWSIPSPIAPAGMNTLGEDINPDIATNASGVWIVAWQSRVFGGHSGSKCSSILGSRSVDDGETWSPPFAIVQDFSVNQRENTNPQIQYLATDERWLVTGKSRGDTSGDISIRASHSSDDGATWSTPTTACIVTSDDTAVDATTEVHIGADGTIHAQVCASSPSTRQLLVARATSSDGGKHWTALQQQTIRPESIRIAGLQHLEDRDEVAQASQALADSRRDYTKKTALAALCFYTLAGGYYGFTYRRRRKALIPAPVSPLGHHLGAR